MTPETFIKMVEEMMDLKIQLHAEVHIKQTPDLIRLVTEKREADRQRLHQIRTELVRFLGS